MSDPPPPPLTSFVLFVSAGASEGKMVVLALAIGVAEQDDFANIPDLQETAQAAPPANQEAPPEKRYRVTHECLLCVTERSAGGLGMAAALRTRARLSVG